MLQIYDSQVLLVDNKLNYETLKLNHRLIESQFNFIKEPKLTRECARETMLQMLFQVDVQAGEFD